MNQKYIHKVVRTGSYISYQVLAKPITIHDGNGVKGEHTFYPSMVRKWNVLQNELNVVELVPAESAGRLTLFGAEGWRNSVMYLQKICESFGGGELNARSIGGTYLEPSISMECIQQACRKNQLASLADCGYTSDLQYMQNGGTPARISWFASRLVEKLSSGGYALKMRLSLGNRIGESVLAELDKDGKVRNEYENTFDICPVIIMPYNMVVESGDGSRNNPFNIVEKELSLFAI